MHTPFGRLHDASESCAFNDERRVVPLRRTRLLLFIEGRSKRRPVFLTGVPSCSQQNVERRFVASAT